MELGSERAAAQKCLQSLQGLAERRRREGEPMRHGLSTELQGARHARQMLVANRTAAQMFVQLLGLPPQLRIASGGKHDERGLATPAGADAGSTYSSITTCALTPPKPNDDTPARRGS